MKCIICHEIIEENKLHLEPKKNREGELICNEKGQIYINYHIRCFEFRKKENKSWDDLYQYILRTFFIKSIPPYLIGEVQNLRNGNDRKLKIKDNKYQGYNYIIILGCLKKHETNIISGISKIENGNGFTSETAKCNYIMSALKNNIDKFYADKIKKINDSPNELDVDKISFDEKPRQEVEDTENYDILI